MNFEIIFCFNINLFVTPLPRNDKLHYQSILEIGTHKKLCSCPKAEQCGFSMQ